MIVIVEGMDNAGKTSLIKRLQQVRPEAEVRKITEGRAPTVEEIHDYVDELIARAEEDEDTIFDRHSIISEPIYGGVLRGGSRLSEDEVNGTVDWLVARGKASIIYCRPPTERILDFGDRWQMDGVVDRAVALLDGYDRYFADEVASWPIPHFVYDWTVDPRALSLLLTLQTKGLW